MTLRNKIIRLLALFSLVHILSFPAFSLRLICLDAQPADGKNFKNVLNINLGAAVVLGLSFRRFHLPLNYERVVNNKISLVIGCHPAFPLNRGSFREAWGASLRIRSYRGGRAPRGFWRELGVWGIYQHQKSSEEERSAFSKAYGNSMMGVLFDFGYKYIIPNNNLIVEPFLGIALPMVVISKEKRGILGWPFPWAGLSVGYVF